MSKKNLAIVSFEDGLLHFHEFSGEGGWNGKPCVMHFTQGTLEGEGVHRFFEILFLSVYSPSGTTNKNVIVQWLPTWWWVAVVTDGGAIKRVEKIRHRLPGSQGGPAYWAVRKNKGLGYRLVPLKGYKP